MSETVPLKKVPSGLEGIELVPLEAIHNGFASGWDNLSVKLDLAEKGWSISVEDLLMARELYDSDREVQPQPPEGYDHTNGWDVLRGIWKDLDDSIIFWVLIVAIIARILYPYYSGRS